ncbi:hypothetical protein L226DRAFT_287440 [Lentinus tigrinus ALCF2SS1-7]|uniref:uncharacterized protein n=1 Tax=Lentinus tigrinus ALCF2SS1-7 TaxID=1328758 RepID=UPI00116612D1|nr:hypothetical protein L226DRAFT_287440 [Lentinus tigrinus ALCF2SS1-7]
MHSSLLNPAHHFVGLPSPYRPPRPVPAATAPSHSLAPDAFESSSSSPSSSTAHPAYLVPRARSMRTPLEIHHDATPRVACSTFCPQESRRSRAACSLLKRTPSLRFHFPVPWRTRGTSLIHHPSPPAPASSLLGSSAL